MPGHAEALEYLKGRDDIPSEFVAALETSAIREENSKLAKRVQELEPFEKELTSLRKQPVRESAFTKAGVDLEALRPAERRLIEQFEWDGEAPDPEKVSAFVAELELPVTKNEQQQQDPTQQIVSQATGGGGQTSTADDSFHQELEAAEPGEQTREVLAKYGRLAPNQG